MKGPGHGQTKVSGCEKQTSCANSEPDFDFLFPSLLNDAGNLLPTEPSTIAALRNLGESMVEHGADATASIPAAYTYFGQFIDHDITHTQRGGGVDGDVIEQDHFHPLTREQIHQQVSNARTPTLDLDSIYETAAREADGRMIIGLAQPQEGLRVTDLEHDLPRRPKIPNARTPEQIEQDRQAIIGDERNDENLVISQMHVAFLRAHNALMNRGLDRAQAERGLRRRYQMAVLHDFLPTICDPEVCLGMSEKWSARAQADPSTVPRFMPVEFAQAAYRFGHSMVRQSYSFNEHQPDAPLQQLFTFTALSGDISPSPGPSEQFCSLPASWIIDWDLFLGADGTNFARNIDTYLAHALGQLRDQQGLELPGLMAKLAVRNLLRGYLFGLPTGQAIASALGVEPLEGARLLQAVPIQVRRSLIDGELQYRTPLWLYVLAEAGAPAPGPAGEHLGKVGSWIVAETLWRVAWHSKHSVVREPVQFGEIPKNEQTISGIIKLGVPHSVFA